MPKFPDTVSARCAAASLEDKLPVSGKLAVYVDYLRRVVSVNKFYTIGEDMANLVHIFQVVWIIPPALKFVRVDVQEDPMVMEVAIVKYDLRKTLIQDDVVVGLEVYPLADNAVRVGALKLAPWVSLRKNMRVWDAQSVEGGAAVALSAPRLAQPLLGELGLAAPDAPIVYVLEALMEAGWRPATPEQPARKQTQPRPGRISHAKACMKPYLQCCLFWPALREKDLQALVHTGSAKYYSLLLRSQRPQDVPLKARDAQYTGLLLEARAQGVLQLRQREDDGFVDSDDPGEALLSSDASVGELLPGADEPVKPILGVVGDGTVQSDADGAARVGAAAVAGSGSASCKSEASSSSSSSSSDERADDGADGLVLDCAPDADPVLRDMVVADIRIKYDVHFSRTDAAKNYERYVIGCPFHRGCEKKRACGRAQTATLGVYEPHSFLLAWRADAEAFPDAKAHVRHRPTEDAVRDAHRAHFARR